MHRLRVCSITTLALLSTAALAQQEPVRFPTQGIEQPADSVALTADPTSLSVNPGGLAFMQSLELDYAHQGFAGARGKGDGLYLGGRLGPLALGLSSEWMQGAGSCSFGSPCPRRLSYGLGLRLGALGLGATYHTFSSEDSRELDALTTWDAGATLRPLSWLSLGAAVLDAGRPTLGLRQLPRRYAFAAALRPLGDFVNLALDVKVNECLDAVFPATPVACGAGHPDGSVTLDATVVEGVRLVGQLGFRDALDGPLSAQIGLQLDLAHVGVRYAPQFIEGTSPGNSLRVRASADRLPSLSVPHSRGVLVDLRKTLQRESARPLALVFGESRHDPLAGTLALLKRLAGEGDVKVVVLRSGDLPLGMGRAEELRSGIEELRDSGKKVIFYLESGGDLEYYVASSADRVYAAPQAVLTVNGFSATAIFAAAGLDKLGVKAEFFRVGAYKNAPDTFTRSDMSSEQREVQNALLDDLYVRYVRWIVERRHLDEAKVKALLDKGLLKPQEAKEAGLLDGLVYPDQLEDEAGKLVSGKVRLEKVPVDAPGVRDTRWGTPQRIVVVRVEGNILQGEGRRDPFGAVDVAGSEPISRRIRAAADDPSVAAIVVRIDSPGGDGNASDLIWRELQRARTEKHKPVVASMGDVAASGGYYVAAGADEIWAEPSTITGSIGVFIGHFDAEELYGKLGLSMVTVKRGESADLFSTSRDLTDGERKTMQSWVESFYDTFLDRVAGSRKLDKKQVDAVGRGHVWSGVQALEKKLVDHMGGLSEAIRAAKKLAGIAVDEPLDLDDEVASSVELSDLAMQGALTRFPLSGAKKIIKAMSLVGEPGTIRAALPYELEVR